MADSLAVALLAAPAVLVLLVTAALFVAAVVPDRLERRSSSSGPSRGALEDGVVMIAHGGRHGVGHGVNHGVGHGLDRDDWWGSDHRQPPDAGDTCRTPAGVLWSDRFRVMARGPASGGKRCWHLQARLRLLQGSHRGLGRRPRRGRVVLESGRLTFTPDRWGLPVLARAGAVVVPIAAADGAGVQRPGLGTAFSVSSGARRVVVCTRAGAVLEVVAAAPVSIAAVYALTQVAADPLS